jgi:hypothetical protein
VTTIFSERANLFIDDNFSFLSNHLEKLTEKFSQAQRVAIIEKLSIRLAFNPFSISATLTLKLVF